MKYEVIKLENMEFFKVEDRGINILFSIANNDVTYRLGTEVGLNSLKKLRELFHVNDVKYVNQIHSDIIFDSMEQSIKDKEGDGLISAVKNEIIGVFTADCVPVILYDSEKKIIAAVHSGWKGTIEDISKKAAELMKSKYGAKNINVVIGPHIKQCCYEVSENLANKFVEKYGDGAVLGRMLNLDYVIRKQLKGIVKDENINAIDICTKCSKDFKLHSYRRDGNEAGRAFSLVYMK